VRADQCLLGRGVSWPAGLFSALAGFVEAGETLEEAVRREVFEETGVSVGAVRYQASQPWPFAASLMIGCVSQALSSEIRIDPKELADARWFSRSELARAIAAERESPPGGASDSDSAGTRSAHASLILPRRVAIARRLLEAWVRSAG